jgi:hypothetical protein
VSGFEIFKMVKAYNAAAARAEREEAEKVAASNPDPAAKLLNPLGADEREGVPLQMWRGAGQG